MNTQQLSSVEQAFFDSGLYPDFKQRPSDSRLPYLVTQDFPRLGLLTALRFLEWVSENPQGVVSLPTGKTPEYFIKWTQHILKHWNTPQVTELRHKYQLKISQPSLHELTFVQIDEFYPIDPKQENSFYHYVNRFYLDGFGINPKKALLINCQQIPLAQGLSFEQVFPDYKVDLSLRFRDAKSKQEELQQQSIFMVDNWCQEYEQKIQELKGIGFFLGGIGPDGHIAFNVKGSNHFSETRLTATNFATQAAAASDLGGIEVSGNRLVITIGLGTITYNLKATAIIIAAGSAKAAIVQDALEHNPHVLYPATVLQKLSNARFYITRSAASLLKDQINLHYQKDNWNETKSQQAVIDLCRYKNKYGYRLTRQDLESDIFTSQIPNLNSQTVSQVQNHIIAKLQRGITPLTKQRFYHTGPHHDDILLGMLPYINRHMRESSNQFQFTVMTSGFTAVTNDFLYQTLQHTQTLLQQGKIEMTNYPNFFREGYQYKFDKDVSHFLDKVAQNDHEGMQRGLSHRLVRALCDIYTIENKEQLSRQIEEIQHTLKNSYHGEKNSPDIQKLKGMVREFEEELVWGHFGIPTGQVHHLRLGFYQGEIFTESPEHQRDVLPILQELKEFKPTIISLAMDKEGSGPDTHYKVLQAIAEALRMWQKEEDLSHIKIWGYRNVWYRFHATEADVIVPVSLNSLSVINSTFSHCYLSQIDASFPSHEYDGKFSELTQKIWVQQFKELQLLLGKDFFYQHQEPLIRSAHGMLFFKEMSIEEFLKSARCLEKSMEGIEIS